MPCILWGPGLPPESTGEAAGSTATALKEALRDLIRAREDASQDLLKKRNQLTKFFLRLDVRQPNGVKPWSAKYRKWLNTVNFEQLPLQIVLSEYIHAIE